MIAAEVESADRARIDELRREFDGLVSGCMDDMLRGSAGADSGTLAVLIGHVRHRLEGGDRPGGAAGA